MVKSANLLAMSEKAVLETEHVRTALRIKAWDKEVGSVQGRCGFEMVVGYF